jgi:hypothetical protein
MTSEVYQSTRDRIERYQATMKRLYPNTNGFTPDMIRRILETAGLAESPTNEERSAVEVHEFQAEPPDRYFLYINEAKKLATTWTGDKLGLVEFGKPFRDNFGGKRIPITVQAINGRKYHGTYFASSGEYARIKLAKGRKSNA